MLRARGTLFRSSRGIADFLNGIPQVIASRRKRVADSLPGGCPIGGLGLADRGKNLTDSSHALKKKTHAIGFPYFHAFNISPLPLFGKHLFSEAPHADYRIIQPLCWIFKPLLLDYPYSGEKNRGIMDTRGLAPGV
jgi:hypothetical protein